ncbi:MAG: hypothetical protein WBG43_04385 [Marinifilaceae bacterium]
MAWDIKPNQYTIFKIKEVRTKDIKAIKAVKIDVREKTITDVTIKNNIEYIQKKCNFYSYEEIKLNEESDYFIIGNDEDSKGDCCFSINGITKVVCGKTISKIFYGNAILIKMPKSGDLGKLKDTKSTSEDIEQLITFY